MPEERILVFAKAPRPGAVKTRLIPALGPAGAAALYRRMARDCIKTALAASPGSVELWCAPDSAHPFFRQSRTRWRLPLREQAHGSIGARMSEALRAALAEVKAAILIGTDVPALTAADLRAALAALHAGCDAAFVPTEDGGYGLVGLRRHDARLFQGIDWSTPSVMEQTRARLAQLHCNWLELPARWDVDRPDDLARLAADPRLGRLRAAGARSPSLQRTDGLSGHPSWSA